jgi:hypothetical protein
MVRSIVSIDLEIIEVMSIYDILGLQRKEAATMGN